MLDMLMVALLQAVAGDPAAAASPAAAALEHAEHAPTEAPEAAADAAPAEAPQAADTQTAAAPAERQYRRERRCQEVEVTGRRMPQRVCQNVMVPVENDTTGQ